MAQAGEVDQLSTPAASMHDSDDSIMNRKGEYRSISSSFSSNLGRPRNSPPQSSREQNGTLGSSSNSVRAIVAWLESSTQKPSSFNSGDGNSSRVNFPPKTSYASPTFRSSQQTVQLTPDVEEYSLTLLKYRQYFTDKPLERCLDELPATSKASKPPQKWRAESLVNQTFAVETTAIRAEDDTETSQHSNANGPREPQQPPEEPCKALESPASLVANPPPLIHRDLEEVERFWGLVRAYLWISDNELDGRITPMPSQGQNYKSKTGRVSSWDSAVRHDGTTRSSSGEMLLPLDSSSHSTTHVAFRTSQSTPRKRLLNTEEKLVEIDAFLDEDVLVPLEEVSGPSHASLSGRHTGHSVDWNGHEVCGSEILRCASCFKLKAGGSALRFDPVAQEGLLEQQEATWIERG